METFQIYKNLGLLNELPVDEAEVAFRDCCRSDEWARRMAAARPFQMLEDLYESAETIWLSLSESDRIEAFGEIPQARSTKPALIRQFRAAVSSIGELSAENQVADNLESELAALSNLYREKFGFIFIVYSADKTVSELIAICRARFGNSAETELRIATDEQRKIISIRLNKLLEQ